MSKLVKIQGRQVKITEPELRGLKTLRNAGYVALISDLFERRAGGYGTCLLPGGTTEPSKEFWPEAAAEEHYLGRKCRWDLLGVERWERWSEPAKIWSFDNYPKKVINFFKNHPRARVAITGSVRRINSILRQVEKTP